MKEIDIKKIIQDNFGDKISKISYKEYPSIYEALHSSEYRKVSQRNFGAICEGFNVAELTFEYKDIPMYVVFKISFDFEYAGRKTCDWVNLDNSLPKEYPDGNKFSVKPVLGIDEISIELYELSKINKKAYKLFRDNIPNGGGRYGGQFRYHCISGMHCEGHGFGRSHVKLDRRIVDFFNYLLGMTDKALLYQNNILLKPKMIGVEQTSYIDDSCDCDHYYVQFED